jgi:hypothetical protein
VIVKEIGHKISALFLVFVVLFSTTSFTVERHLCMDNVYSYAFFGHAKECGMKSKICRVNDEDNDIFSENTCCVNDFQVKKASTTVQSDTVQLKNQEISFLTDHIFANLGLVEVIKHPLNNSTKYPPPLIENKISIFYQVFLI